MKSCWSCGLILPLKSGRFERRLVRAETDGFLEFKTSLTGSCAFGTAHAPIAQPEKWRWARGTYSPAALAGLGRVLPPTAYCLPPTPQYKPSRQARARGSIREFVPFGFGLVDRKEARVLAGGNGFAAGKSRLLGMPSRQRTGGFWRSCFSVAHDVFLVLDYRRTGRQPACFLVERWIIRAGCSEVLW